MKIQVLVALTVLGLIAICIPALWALSPETMALVTFATSLLVRYIGEDFIEYVAQRMAFRRSEAFMRRLSEIGESRWQYMEKIEL